MRPSVRLASLAFVSVAFLFLDLPSECAPNPSFPPRLLRSHATFEVNVGQADPQVRFLLRGSSRDLFLTSSGAVLVFRNAPAVLRMRFIGANPHPRISGIGANATQSSYFIGRDPARWRGGVRHYDRVHYSDLYPRTDLVFYEGDNGVEYDFILRDGADPDTIRIGFEGPEAVHVDGGGRLVLSVGGHEVVQPAPRVYQEERGSRRQIPARYRMIDRSTIGFDVGAYENKKPLIIDPVLAYSTYFGGSSSDSVEGIAVDASGFIYVAGFTTSSDFPVEHSRQIHVGYYEDAFLSKFSPDGSTLIFSTYLGGSATDLAWSLALDASGNAYLTGLTQSWDFPNTNPGASFHFTGGASTPTDVFVTKISPAGGLVYSTFLGGYGSDKALGIAVDGAGSAWVVGETSSADFPVVNPVQTWPGPDWNHAFVTKLNAAGNVLQFSTYLGGRGGEFAWCVAVDSRGDAYVAGMTSSADFPLVRPIRRHFEPIQQEGFLAKFQGQGGSIVYSTLLGSAAPSGIAVDGSGSVYLSGTASYNWNGYADFPLKNPIRMFSSDADAFAMKINASGSAFVYSTFIGGSGYDIGHGIAVDREGQAYLTGYSSSSDFPRVGSPQISGTPRSQDVYLTKLGPDGSVIVASSLLGGSSTDEGHALAVDGSGNAFVAGRTYSSDFPTVQAFQPGSNGGIHGFIAKITDTATAPQPRRLPGPGRIEQDDPEVRLNDGWYTNSAPDHSRGGAILAFGEPSRAVFSFRGILAKWTGLRDEWSGIARVYLDGVFMGTVDTYASPSEYQAALYTTPLLDDGPHTLVIEPTGQKNSLSGGPWIWIDAFDVAGPASFPSAGPPKRRF